MQESDQDREEFGAKLLAMSKRREFELIANLKTDEENPVLAAMLRDDKKREEQKKASQRERAQDAKRKKAQKRQSRSRKRNRGR